MKEMKKMLSVLMAGALSFVLLGASVTTVAANAEDTVTPPVETLPVEVTTMTELKFANHNLAGAPSVVSRLSSKAQLAKLLNNQKPANLIMTMNTDGNVVDEQGDVIGEFTTLYSTYVQGKILPVVEVKDAESAGKLVDIWTTEISIVDMAVMSADATILSEVRTALPKIRGIYDCSEKMLVGEESWHEAIATANKSMANVIVLSDTQTTIESTIYFQHRFKTVWTEIEETTDFDVKRLVATGTYGIISKDFQTVYTAYEDYAEGSVSRISTNIAHRGLPNTMTENTLAGYKKAYEKGATHIEVDTWLTKDKEIVIMHDASIDRTTNGTGIISQMTLEELRQYQVTKSMTGVEIGEEPIPTVRELFAEFKDKDLVIVFEIKTSDTAICAALKSLLDAYSIWDQVVIITFNDSMLKAVQEQLPEIPQASLADFSKKQFEKNVPRLNEMNAVPDANMGQMGNDNYYDAMMKDRGYMSYFWTFGTAQTCVDAMKKGAYGLTNNAADEYGTLCVGVLHGKAGQTVKKEALKEGANIAVATKTYAGEEKEVIGKVFAVKDCGEYAEVIATVNEVTGVLYTPVFCVTYEAEKPVEPDSSVLPNLPVEGTSEEVQMPIEGKKGCGSALSVGVPVVVILVGVYFVRKKKES